MFQKFIIKEITATSLQLKKINKEMSYSDTDPLRNAKWQLPLHLEGQFHYTE